MRPKRSLVPAVLSVTLAMAAVVAAEGGAAAMRAAAAPAASGLTAGSRADAALAAAARVPAGPQEATSAAFDPTKVSVRVGLVKSGFTAPLLVTNAHDGSGRLFVVEQAGDIRVIDGGYLRATPFLDLRGQITSGDERGLLGLAFDPNFRTSPYIYVNFTDRNGNTAISRYRVSSNRNVVDVSSGIRLLTIGQPYPNHNGGNLAFGPDGYLYVGMGDGGSSGDPENRAQNIDSLLGKMLRIDVHHSTSTTHYVAPADNPYVGRSGNDLIWSRGLRNPWRFSFDMTTGQLWIGDVGQGRWEEIDRSSKVGSTAAGRGANYGWPILEGRACFKPATGCSSSGTVLPLATYGHVVSGADNCAVTGGFAYHGSAYPVLSGGYIFGDFCSGRMWLLSTAAASPATPTLVRDDTASPHLSISSFGEDEAGELYVTDLAGGGIYRIAASAKP